MMVADSECVYPGVILSVLIMMFADSECVDHGVR